MSDIETDDDQRLKYGWTTGACATAAAKAAYMAMADGAFPDAVEITLPKGQMPVFELERTEIGNGFTSAAVVKDAGDDPDVTHGAIIECRLERTEPGSGVIFKAGNGVGTVTREGLPLAVGEPAINPAPRQMIIENIEQVHREAHGPLDLAVTISVDDGERLARKTWNERLGIIGGLSILGTTGIVVPYSCSAWIHSIHRGIDVARAAALDHVVGSTGSTSETAAMASYELPLIAFLDMGDFVGGLLKYLRNHPVPRLTIAGGFGKISKLAAGHMDLHSKRSQVSPAFLSQLAEKTGAESSLVADIEACSTAGAILNKVQEKEFPLGDAIATAAKAEAEKVAEGAFIVEVIIYDRLGTKVGRADFK
ncbi:MAG: cobalt-precorrin-5B (C(1))-methyltransferase [Rhodospirillaceae bacterium]|nr:cobalt-precorrin-5B (C(1))-methyltransferase [Rhodospirillaceae bacterium]|tara:strand:+ start:150958 stop:152055 length:1098 start_codon:yes stop_codon:yes gene_type:complete